MFNCIPGSEGLKKINWLSPAISLYDRAEVVKNFIKQLGLSAGMKEEDLKKIDLRCYDDIFNKTPAAGENILWLPALLFVNFEDIGFGNKFAVKDLKELDEKVAKDPNWLQSLADNLAYIFGRKKVTVTREHRETIRLTVRFLKEHQGQPEKVVSALRFVFLHELGHLKHEHSSCHEPKNQLRWTLIGGLAAALVTYLICFALSATLFGLIIAVPIAFVVTAVAVKIIREVEHSRIHEREADLFAMSALKGEEGKKVREGGLYLFNILRKHQFELTQNSALPWYERFLFNIAFSKDGNNRFLYFTHPSEEDRIKAIDDFEKRAKEV